MGAPELEDLRGLFPVGLAPGQFLSGKGVKSSAELLLRLRPGNIFNDEVSVFTGVDHGIEVVRQRFLQVPANVVSIRKPPQRATAANWPTRATWAGPR